MSIHYNYIILLKNLSASLYIIPSNSPPSLTTILSLLYLPKRYNIINVPGIMRFSLPSLNPINFNLSLEFNEQILPNILTIFFLYKIWPFILPT